MPHIPIRAGLPGIRGLFAFRPETAQPMSELAEVLLHTPGTLTPGERELIAIYVSSRNDCYYCQTAHGAIGAQHLGGNEEIVDEVKRDFEHAAVSDKLKALLAIAGRVQSGGKQVWAEDVARARCEGATDREIHDTGADRGRFLHVQPLCGRPGHLVAHGPGGLSRAGRRSRSERLSGRAGIYSNGSRGTVARRLAAPLDFDQHGRRPDDGQGEERRIDHVRQP